MKYFILAFLSLLLSLLPVGSLALAQMRAEHNDLYPQVSDRQASDAVKGYLIANGISGQCHPSSNVDREENIKWKFRKYNEGLVAEALVDSFVTFGSPVGVNTYTAEVSLVSGNFIIKILSPKKIHFWAGVRLESDKLKVDLYSGGSVLSYEENDSGPIKLGSCKARTGDLLAGGKSPRPIKIKPMPVEVKQMPNAQVQSLKRVSIAEKKLCPLEAEIAKTYLLEHGIRSLIPRTYRTLDLANPMPLDFNFREIRGELFAVSALRTLSLSEFSFVLEGASPGVLYPTKIEACEDLSDGGQQCPVVVQLPKYVVTYYINVPSRTGEIPAKISIYECSAESKAKTLLGYGGVAWAMPCRAQEPVQNSQPDNTLRAKVEECKVENNSGD